MWVRLAGTALLGLGVVGIAACAGKQKQQAAAPEAKAEPKVEAKAPPKPDAKLGPIDIDNEDPEGRFTATGSWNQDPAGGDFAGTYCHWTTPDGDATARWQAKLPKSGNWKVSVWYGEDPNDDHATDAPFTVEHADGSTTIKVNEKEHQKMWFLLGTYRFDASKPAAVVLSNKASSNVIADAVRFEPE